MTPLAPWHQYAHDAVAAGRAEAAVQEKLRPIVLRIKALEKDEANAAQVAALTRKADALREQLRAMPVRVGRYVMLACERHLRDLETGHERGLLFSDKVAGAAVRFYSFLTHNKGKWAGTPLTLEGWQQFIIASLFGWKRADGTRRFRESYTEVARKNGKSTLGSGVGLQLLVADGEQGAEVYCAATKKEQARIVFGDAQNMARKSTALTMLRVQQHSVFVPGSMSKMVPMSADAKTEDGLNPHGIIIDEYHAHPNDELYGVLKSATGARAQPLLSIITTAGFNRLGPCAQLRKACVGILEQTFHDDAYFTIIFALDEGDEWADESTWQKANPNLDVSVSLDYLREQYRAAERTPSLQVNFKTKHLNLWTDSAITWFPSELWQQGNGGLTPDELAGRECYGGLDLASVRDLCALVLVFPDGSGGFDTRRFYWMPADTITEAAKRDQVPYQQWVDEGCLFATPGNVTDYNYIKAQINELCGTHLVNSIGYDRNNASQMVIDLLADGVPMVPFSQRIVTMSAPTKELERLVGLGLVRHNADPVLAWMNGNVWIYRDSNDNIKIDKAKARNKVDGMVALVMAIGEYMGQEKEEDNIYDSRGLLSF